MSSIYDGVEKLGLQPDMQSWMSINSPVFEELIHELKPKVIIEVGSWKGRSAIKMAELTKDYGTTIYCCDTWLGATEHILDDKRDYKFPTSHGYPMIYFQFLVNVKSSGHHERIIPVPNTSMDCARILYHRKVRADLIYIDADHTAKGAFDDMTAYWELFANPAKRVMFGDDYITFPGVADAAKEFCKQHNLKAPVVKDPMWIIRND